MKILLDITIQL